MSKFFVLKMDGPYFDSPLDRWGDIGQYVPRVLLHAVLLEFLECEAYMSFFRRLVVEYWCHSACIHGRSEPLRIRGRSSHPASVHGGTHAASMYSRSHFGGTLA